MENNYLYLKLDNDIDWGLTFIRKLSINNKQIYFQFDAKLLPSHPKFDNYLVTDFGVYIQLELIFSQVTNYSLIDLELTEPIQLEFDEDNEAQIYSIAQKGREFIIDIDLDVIHETLNSIKIRSEPPILKYGEQAIISDSAGRS